MKKLLVLPVILLSHVSYGRQNISFPQGLYTGEDIAARFASIGYPMQASRELKSRIYRLNLRERPVDRMLKLLSGSIGLETCQLAASCELGFSKQERKLQADAAKALDSKVCEQFSEMLLRLRTGHEPKAFWKDGDKIDRAWMAYSRWGPRRPRLFATWYLSTHRLSDLRQRSFFFCGRLEKLFDTVKAPQWLRDAYINEYFTVSGEWGRPSLYGSLEAVKKDMREARFFFRISYAPYYRSFFIVEERVQDSQSGWLSEGAFMPIPELTGNAGNVEDSGWALQQSQAISKPDSSEIIQDYICDTERIAESDSLFMSRSLIDGVETVRYKTFLFDSPPATGSALRLAQRACGSLDLKEVLKCASRLSDVDLANLFSDSRAWQDSAGRLVLLPFMRLISKLTDKEQVAIQEAIGNDVVVIDLCQVQKQDRQALHRVLMDIVRLPSNLMGSIEIDSLFVSSRSADSLRDCYIEICPSGHGNDLEIRVRKYSQGRQERVSRVSNEYPGSEVSYARAIAYQCSFVRLKNR